MHAENWHALAERVARAAAATLHRQGYAALIDVMVVLGWLARSQVLEWRTRRLPFLAVAIQTDPRKVAAAMRLFATWAEQQGLLPSPTDYVARSAAREPLRFSASGDPAIEEAWRTHWVSSDLPAAQRTRIEAKANKPPELVAIKARYPDWKCHRCGGSGALLVMEPEGAACLPCGGLGGLEMIPSGDGLLTRRARAKSKLSAIVLRWVHTRGRYQRIGTLVEPAALAAARASLGPDVHV